MCLWTGTTGLQRWTCKGVGVPLPRVPAAHGVGFRRRRVLCPLTGPDFRRDPRLYPRERQRLSRGAPLLPRVRNDGVLVSVAQAGHGGCCSRQLRRPQVSISASAGLRTPSTRLGHADALASRRLALQSPSPRRDDRRTAVLPSRGPIPLSRDGFPGATADLPRSTRKGSASKLRPLVFACAVIAPAPAH